PTQTPHPYRAPPKQWCSFVLTSSKASPLLLTRGHSSPPLVRPTAITAAAVQWPSPVPVGAARRVLARSPGCSPCPEAPPLAGLLTKSHLAFHPPSHGAKIGNYDLDGLALRLLRSQQR